MAVKAEVLKSSFIRPEPRAIIKLRPEEVREFVNTKEIDFFRVYHTPEIARVCATLNREDNRAVSKHKLAQIGRDMEHGTNVQFKENGDTIKFDWNGRMFDGQKRNKAVIISDVPQVLTWALGLDPEAHFVTDKGQKRSLGDSLRIEGYKNYTIHAAAGAWLYIIKYCNDPSGLALKQRLGSDEEVYTLIKRHPGLVQACGFVHGSLPKRNKDSLIPPSLLAVIYYLASAFLRKEEEAKFFVNHIIKFPLDVAYPHAEKTNGYNPVNLWMKFLRQRRDDSIFVTREEKGTGTMYVWNLYAAGKRIEKASQFKLPKYSAIVGLNLDLI